jgi:hypothetical protein
VKGDTIQYGGDVVVTSHSDRFFSKVQSIWFANRTTLTEPFWEKFFASKEENSVLRRETTGFAQIRSIWYLANKSSKVRKADAMMVEGSSKCPPSRKGPASFFVPFYCFDSPLSRVYD